MLSTCSELSLEKRSSTASCSGSGQSSRALSTAARTTLTVSMMLKPLRLTTCNETVVSPLNRAVPSRSSKVSRISARSPSVTTLSPLTFTGRA